jgi:hypothetical protein
LGLTLPSKPEPGGLAGGGEGRVKQQRVEAEAGEVALHDIEERRAAAPRHALEKVFAQDLAVAMALNVVE